MDYNNMHTTITKETLLPFIIELVKWYEDNGLDIRPLPQVIVSHSPNNSNDPLGKTGYYDFRNQQIVLFVDGRHIKDVLRSFCHELIHHNQYIEYGDIETETENLNKSNFLQKLEGDAYFRGNMLFRGWSDNVKNTR